MFSGMTPSVSEIQRATLASWFRLDRQTAGPNDTEKREQAKEKRSLVFQLQWLVNQAATEAEDDSSTNSKKSIWA